MRRFFVDTFYWIALFSRRDRWHARVAAFDATLDATDHLYTTDEVFTEFLAYFSLATPRLRTRAARYVQALLATPGLTVLPQTRTGFLQALALYLARPGTPRAGDCVAPRTVAEAIREGRRLGLAAAGAAGLDAGEQRPAPLGLGAGR